MFAIVVALAGAAEAQVNRAFTLRAGTGVNVPGDIVIIGNSVLTCSTTKGGSRPTSNCVSARNLSSTSGPINDNDFFNDYIQVVPGTLNSSSATLVLDANSSVVWAGLYWDADLTAGDQVSSPGNITYIPRGSAPPQPNRRGYVKLRTPTTGGFVEVQSTQHDQSTHDGDGLLFQEFADVTALVRSGGGGTYTVADVQAATGANRAGGWALVVLVQDPDQPLRNLSVFDGSALLSNTTQVNLTVSGFTTPRVGPVTSRIGVVAVEGDFGLTGDQLRLENTVLSDAPVRGADNFFNSGITRLGAHVTNRNPAFLNNLGFDIAYLSTTNILANGATQARIRLTTSGDTYMPHVVAFATDLFAASLASTVFKTVTDLNGGVLFPGDTLEYRISAHNASGDGVKQLTLIDTIAPNTDYVAGSLAIITGRNAGPKTDAAGDDQAEFEGARNRVVFHLGRDTLSATGVLLPGESQSIRFRVVVRAGTAGGTVIPDQGHFSYFTLTTSEAHPNDPTDGDVQTPGAQSTNITVVVATDVEAIKQGPPTATVGVPFTYRVIAFNNGPGTATNVVVSDTVPAGLTIGAVSGDAIITGRVITWPTISVLPAQSHVAFDVTVTAAVTGSYTDIVAASSTTIDPNPANNNGSQPAAKATTDVRIPEADIVVTKTGPDTAQADADITYTITVRNLGPAAALDVIVSDTIDLVARFRGANRQGAFELGRTVAGLPDRVVWPAIPSLPPGGVETFTLTVHTPALGGTIVDIAAATTRSGDPNPSNNDGSAPPSRVITFVPGPSDVVVRKTGPSLVLGGSTFTYQVTIENVGPDVARNVVLTDTLPANVTFLSATGGATLTGRVVTWPLVASYASERADTFSVTVRAPAGPDTITQIVAASLEGVDSNPTNNDGSSSDARVRTIVALGANVGLTKSGPATVGVGDRLTWTIVVANAGPGVASNVVVTDTLPVGATFVAASGGGAASGQVVTWPAIATLASGASRTFTVSVQAPASAGALLNVAAATTTTIDPSPADNRATFQTSVVESADVSVIKSGPTNAPAGSNVAYVIRIENLGPSAAQSVVVTDTLPAGVTFVGASDGGALAGNVVSWPAITLANGDARDLTLTVQLPAAVGTIRNVAAIQSPTLDPVVTNNRAVHDLSVVTPPPLPADVSVSKSAPASVSAGGTFTYTVGVANEGPGDAESVVLVDTLPSGVTFVSATGGPTLVGQVLTWPAMTLSSGSSETFQVVVTAPASATTLDNIAGASSSSPDPDLANNRVVASTVVTALADLSIDKSGPVSALTGSAITYTLTVTNNGPSAAANVVTRDTLPAGATFVGASGGGTLAGNVVTWPAITLLASGASQAFTLDVLAPATAGVFTNAADVASSTADANAADNHKRLSSFASAPPPTNADVSVGKVGPASVVAGGSITYVLTVTNGGPVTATDVVLTDSLPAGVTFVSASGGPTVAGRQITWPTIPALANGGTQSFTVNVTAPNAAATLENVARVTATTPDPDAANNRDVASTAVTPLADLRIAKSGPASVLPSGAISYSITATNSGPSDAMNVVVRDTLPAGTTFVGASGGGVLSGNVVTWPGIAVLASGGSQVFTLDILAPATPGPVINAAVVGSDTQDPNASDNHQRVTTSVSPAPPTDADVSVEKVAPASVSAAGNIRYVLTVTNGGPVSATDVVLTDSLPAGVTFVSATGGPTIVGRQITWPTIPVLASGGAQSFLVNVSAPNGAATLENVARVAATTPDPDAANNRALASTTVTPLADLGITKSGPSSAFNGAPVAYTLTVTNAGPSDAANVVVRDTLPAGATFVAASGGGVSNGGVVTWPTIPLLASGASQSFTLDITAPATGGVMVNAVAAGAETPDPNASDNHQRIATSVSPAPPTDADVFVSKTGPASVLAGELATYSITVSNAGPLPASNVTVIDSLPAGSTLVGTTGGGVAVPGGVAWPPIASLAPGASQVFNITVRAPVTGPSMTNIARVSATTPDPDPSNDRATASTIVVDQADLSIAKAGARQATRSAHITYTIRFSNAGPSTARDVVVIDTLPDGVSFIAASEGGALVGRKIVWPALASLAAGASHAYALTVTMPVDPGSYVDEARVTSVTVDPNADNNHASFTTVISPPVPEETADVSVAKSGPASVAAGSTFAYTITVSNAGPGAAANVQVVDSLPPAVGFVSASNGGALSGGVVRWPSIPSLAPGVTVTFTIQVTAPPSGTLVNVAASTSTTTDPIAENNDGTAGTVTTAVITSSDLSIAKEAPLGLTSGVPALYRITAGNAGPSVARNVVVADQLPAGLVFVSASDSGAVSGSTVTWPATTLGVGDSRVYDLVVRLVEPVAPGTVIRNSASISSSEFDPNSTNNAATSADTVGARADVAVVKSGPLFALPNAVVTWFVTVTNHGPSPAIGVTVGDSLPAGIVAVEISGGGSVTGNVVRWPVIDTLRAGAEVTFEIRAQVPASGTLVDVAFANSASNDPRPHNNDGSDPRSRSATHVVDLADVVVRKTGPATASPGEEVTYTITVFNRGPAVADAIVVSDSVAHSVVLVAATRGGAMSRLGGSASWPVIPALNPGDTISFQLTLRMPNSGVVDDIAAAVHEANDPLPINNDGSLDSARVKTVIISGDVRLTKAAVGSFDVGGIGRWRFTLQNVGVGVAAGPLRLLDTLPAGLEFSGVASPSDGWSCSAPASAPRVVTCVRPDSLDVGGTSQLTILTRIVAANGNPIINVARLDAPGDIDSTNNVATATVTPNTLPALLVQKAASRAVVEIGDALLYTISVRNLIADDVPSVLLTDTLPLGFSYIAGSTRINGAVAGDPAGSPGPLLVLPLGTIAASSTVLVTYRVRVGPAATAGDATNRVAAGNTHGARSNPASVRVHVEGGVFTDRATIVGQVTLGGSAARSGSFADAVAPEPIAGVLGVPGVRVVLEDGSAAVTDGEGKFSFVGLSPRVHVLKLDATTLPPGATVLALSSRQIADGRSRIVDLRRSELARADFRFLSDDSVRQIVRQRSDSAAKDDLAMPDLASAASIAAAPTGTPAQSLTLYRPLAGDLEKRVKENTELHANAEPVTKPRIELVVPREGVSADGTTPVTVKVRLVGDSASNTTTVTLESTLGRWDATDADSTTPGVQVLLTGRTSEYRLFASAREGTSRVRVTADRASATDTIAFIPSTRPMLISGLVEARLDLRSLAKGTLLSVSPNDEFEDRITETATRWNGGQSQVGARGALYLRGKIAGDMLLTLAYDSERDSTERTFRDIRPDEFYPVYGDASVREFGAQSFDRLYVRVDAAHSYLLYGDFTTPSTNRARELGAYLRTFTGALAHYESRRAAVNAYGNQSREHLVVDELPGKGTSGPYTLTSPNGRLNTERVEILTRDRTQPARIIRIVPMQRFLDYTLEPFTGRLLFRQPIPMVDEALNPVSIRATYEVEGDVDSFWNYGTDASVKITSYLEVGGVVGRDRDPSHRRDLYGANATLALGRTTQLLGEWARTTDDSLSGGNAGRLELRHASQRIEGVAFAERTDSGFSNPFSTTGRGRDEFGARGALGIISGTRLLFDGVRSENRANGGRLDGLQASIEQKLPLRFRAEFGYRWSSRTDSAYTPAVQGIAGGDINALRFRLTDSLGHKRPATLYAEYEQDVHGRDNRRAVLGGDYRIDPRLKLYGRSEFINSLAGPYALNSQQGLSSTVFGFSSTWLETGQVYSEYRVKDAMSGRDNEAAIGLRNRWTVAPGLALDASFERLDVTKGIADREATAVTGAVEYTRPQNWKGTARFEMRDAKVGNDYLATLGYALRINRDFTLLGRGLISELASGDRRDRAQLGLAWRQLGDGAWNGLARIEHTDERLPGLVGAFDGTHTAEIVSMHLNWSPNPRLVVGPLFALKAARDHGGDADVSTTTWLGQLRATQDVDRWWDVGVTGSVLGANVGGYRYGLGGEVGRRLIQNLRAAVGYNVFGFRDHDLRETDYTMKGGYLKLDLKFDELMFRRR